MSFIQQQLHSFLNLGACKEYPTMARLKSPASSKQTETNAANSTVALQAGAVDAAQIGASWPDTRKMGSAKSESRPSLGPINLEDEIRRRAYELSERRGFEGGHETEDWLDAEREVLARYRQRSA
jgi:hypothetical protein